MKERTRTEYSVLNIISGLGGYILNTIIGFICRIVFTRCLSADYLGVNGLFTNILTMLSLAELGIGSAIVYALYKPIAEHDEEKIASLMKIYGAAYKTIGIIVAVIGLLLLPFLNIIIQEQPNINESIYLLYILNLFNTASTYFYSYRSSLLIAAQMNYLVSGINYLVTIFQSLFQILFLIVTRNYLVYLLIQTIGIFIYNIMVSKIAINKFPFIKQKNAKPLPEKEKRQLFANIRDLMIYKISGLLVNSTDNILITFFKGLATTGIASNYTLFVNTLNSLLNQVFNGLTASIGNHNATESNEKKFEMFSFINLMNFWIFGWGFLGIIFCSTDLVRFCFGDNYVLPISIPLVLALNFYTVGLQNAIWTYKQTMGLFHYGRFLQIITAILNIVFSIILGYKWGVFGILFATFFARLLTNLWYDPYVLFIHGFNKSPIHYLVKYFQYIVALGIAVGICCVILIPIRLPIFIQIMVKILICSIVCNIVFYIMFRKTQEFYKLKSIINYTYIILFKKENK